MRTTAAMGGAALLTLFAQSVAAQPVGIHAEGGMVRTHGVSAPAAAFHVFRSIDRASAIRVDGGAIGDVYGLAFDAGVDYRAPAAARFTVVLRAGAGLLIEGPDWAGAFLRAGAGVAWRYTSNGSMTVMFDSGTHGGVAGPHRVMAGWERRFGRIRSP